MVNADNVPWVLSWSINVELKMFVLEMVNNIAWLSLEYCGTSSRDKGDVNTLVFSIL